MDNLILVEHVVESLPQSIKIYVKKWISRLKRPANLSSEKQIVVKYCKLLRLQVKAILDNNINKLEDPFNKFPKDNMLLDIPDHVMARYLPKIERKKSVEFLEELNILEKSYQQDLAKSNQLNLELSQAPLSFSPQSNQQKNDLMFLDEIEKSMNMCKTRASDMDQQNLSLLQSSINQLEKSSRMINKLHIKENDYFHSNLTSMVQETEQNLIQFQKKINQNNILIKKAVEIITNQSSLVEVTCGDDFIDISQ
ncbi:hypothetical protein SS50377_26899 [Spironucleus salmonicida]|uniref:DUF4485 domain-containing protein n=1 Tax=Spironucleus salmonicida TaxID=348837 RepID=V6LS59_9EUKA|nr:hypothetical protein SS50377_26899 [Spironucleus salmonicida]|eukprot:EST47410.1 Hypothetical protein SS50377_12396 [Spironucleus salmonicida]